ncbi:MAG TPA: DUF4270 family protein, partial [Flavobacterium sp.]|nr:DUF4270 family protein [Flavobacterium sp.]
AYFKQHILEAGTANLLSNNAFKNYFRGLYFKVAAPASGPASLAMLDFKKGEVEIKYNSNVTTTNPITNLPVVTNAERTIILTMTGNTVSLLELENPVSFYTDAISQAPTAEGHSRIYLKGGEGSVATINLFEDVDVDNNNKPDQLDEIISKGWLINEASITFYVDQTKMVAPLEEPQRLYLYNIKNKQPILDYIFDNTTNADPKLNKGIFGGIAEVNASNRVVKYKIRVTNYLRSIMKDSTYTPLGLSVTEDISNVTMAKLRTPNARLNNYIPTAAVLSPLGTVLYGSNPESGNYDKRMRLEIYYTKPN